MGEKSANIHFKALAMVRVLQEKGGIFVLGMYEDDKWAQK